jgi:uncharacterized protein DUF732
VASARCTPQARFTAVGRADAIRAASNVTFSLSPACAYAASATPKAPETPIAGAPRMARVLIASMTSSTVVIRSRRISCGSARWSMANNAPSAQVIELSATGSDRRPTVVTSPIQPRLRPRDQGLIRPDSTLLDESARQDNRADLDDNAPMRLLFVVANVVAVIGLAVPAQADPSDPPAPPDPAADANFIDSLNKAGMTFRNGPDAIKAGRWACNMMSEGQSEMDVVSKLSALNPGLNTGGAMKFAALASSAYCPEYLSKSSQKSSSPSPFGGLGGQH